MAKNAKKFDQTGRSVIYINKIPIDLTQHKEISKLGIIEGLQAIFDKGLIGEQYKGKRVLESFGLGDIEFKLEALPTEEDTAYAVHVRYLEVEKAYLAAQDAGELTEELKEELFKVRGELDMIRKLSAEDPSR